MKNYQVIAYAILFLAVVSLMFAAIDFGLQLTERANCVKWQKWQNKYPLFTPTKSMRAQCDHYKIELK